VLNRSRACRTAKPENKLELKMNGLTADCRVRLGRASIASNLTGRVLPVFLMRDFARQG
jgi:hypothetical protein